MLFGEHCESGMYTLKFNLMDHVIVDIERLEACRGWMGHLLKSLVCTSNGHTGGHHS